MTEKQTPAQAEAAAIRRRWITLGEILAVVAVVISGLTFWNSYSERAASEAERAAEKDAAADEERKAAERSQTLLLKVSAGRGGSSLVLAPADSGQVIQSLSFAFPSELGAGAIDAVIEPRIEAGWIEKAVKDLESNGSGGDLRLPVVITTRFVSGGETRSDTSLYDVGYRLDRGVLDTDVELSGLALIERARASNAQARLDAIWKSRQ